MELSDYEQNILKELERDMIREDPKLSRRLSGGFSMGPQQIYGVLILVIGLFLLIHSQQSHSIGSHRVPDNGLRSLQGPACIPKNQILSNYRSNQSKAS